MNSTIYNKIKDINFQYKEEQVESNDYFTVAKIISYENEKEEIKGNYLHFTGLIDIDLYSKLRANKIHFRVNTSGPHPFYEPDWEYVPNFWMFSEINGEEYKIEPLIMSWESNQKTILLVDQGFLMTYGLIPRYVNENEVRWDEPSLPDENVIISSLFSNYDFPKYSPAQVKIKKKYIQDYASLRKKIIFRIFYEESKIKKGVIEIPKDKHYKKNLKYTSYWIRNFTYKDYGAVIDIGGYKLLARPGKAPISNQLDKIEPLKWPNYKNPITKNEALSLQFDFVYVNDSVLDIYERNNEKYTISPESCSVWYGNQWTLVCHGRVDRHTIRVELKKLYEGVHPEITKHWNKHAVKDPGKYKRGINIGSLSKKLLSAYVQFGELLAFHLVDILIIDITSEQITNINEHRFYHDFWWDQENIKPVTYHIPHNFNEKDFFNRCKLLSQLIIEPLPEKKIRNALIKLRIHNNSMKYYGSLKLLNTLLRHFSFAQQTGLNIMDNQDVEILSQRIENEYIDNPLETLIQLQEFRKLDAHRVKSLKIEEIISEGNKIFNIKYDFNRHDYESAIEKVYDTLTKVFEKNNFVMKQMI